MNFFNGFFLSIIFLGYNLFIVKRRIFISFMELYESMIISQTKKMGAFKIY